MQDKAALLLAFAFLFVLSGCVATQRDVRDLEGQMDTLQVEMVKLRGTIEGVQKNQADLALKLESVGTDLSQFGENLSGFRESVTTLNTRMEDLSAVIEDNNKQMAAVAKAQVEAARKSPSDLVKEAKVQLNDKQYDLAIEGFQLYLKQNPKGSLADEAQYSIGEAHFATAKYEDAARAYAAVLDQFPTSKITPAARLRYATALLQLDASKHPEAERYLESIPDDFPGSPEAKKAQEQLAKLKSKGAKPAPKSAKPKAPAKSAGSPSGAKP